MVLTDPDGLAAHLLPPDRARLLSALWLLAAPGSAARPGVEAVLSAAPAGRGSIAISLEVAGRRSRDLDPAVWGILGELGAPRVQSSGAGTRVLIEHVPESAPESRRTP